MSINSGSSSVKITLFSSDQNRLSKIASAEISGLTSPPTKLKYGRANEKSESKELGDKIKGHNAAFQYILDAFFSDKNISEVAGKDDITYACHRVVHGGDFGEDQLITEETYHKLEALEDLAPL